jgi:hypothetical protein
MGSRNGTFLPVEALRHRGRGYRFRTGCNRGRDYGAALMHVPATISSRKEEVPGDTARSLIRILIHKEHSISERETIRYIHAATFGPTHTTFAQNLRLLRSRVFDGRSNPADLAFGEASCPDVFFLSRRAGSSLDPAPGLFHANICKREPADRHGVFGRDGALVLDGGKELIED